jgi:hypothetical protein
MNAQEIRAIQEELDRAPMPASPSGPALDRPSAETIAAVAEWEQRVSTVADRLRWLDSMILRIEALPKTTERYEDDLMAYTRDMREVAFDAMRMLNPDQAWFWTEEWQRKEREADEELASGRPLAVYDTDDDFEAALQAHARIFAPAIAM